MNAVKISDKAILVKLSQRSLGTTKREAQLTSELQEQKHDNGLVVMSKLFQDKNNPVNSVLKMVAELYQYHRTKTLPWTDGGPRLLPNNQYLDYTAGIAERKNKLSVWGNEHLDSYDNYVRNDITHRTALGKSHVSFDDYPSKERLQNVLSPIVTVEPVPSSNHFSPVVELSPEDIATFEAQQQERFVQAQQDAVRRVTEPLNKLIQKLSVYQGSSEERFHTSLVTNVIEGTQRAKELTIDASADFVDSLDKIAEVANNVSVDSVKENSTYREAVKNDMETVMRQMAMFAPK